MARVYVSSTYGDLKEHREKVYRALRELGHDAVAMEDYVAADQRPLAKCLDDVAASDLYVGLVGHRYGYVPEQLNPERRSVTELEYRHARGLGIPCLVFLLDPAAPWPLEWVDAVTGDGDKGALVAAFREDVGRELMVGFFATADELARKVAVAVTRQLTSQNVDGYPAQAPPDEDWGGGLRVALLSAGSDARLVSQLVAHLTSMRREGLVSALEHHVVDGGLALPDPALLGDVVLLAMSTELVGSGYLESEDFRRLVGLQANRILQLIPVLLRPVQWSSLPLDLYQIPPLPGPDRSVTQARSRDAAWVEVAEGVRLTCLETVARRRHPKGQPPRPRTARAHHRLVEVFKESGVPSVTYVEPDNFYQLKLDLEQPGRGVVIEGPSGAGKTSALERAIGELGADVKQRFEVLRSRNPEHVERIAALPSWHDGPVAIDDFHRLDLALRTELVDYLKLLADTEPLDRKLVIVGIPGTRQRLVEVAFDIATRIGFIPIGTVRDDKVLEMVEKGEAALNIELVGKSEIVRAAAGSLNIAQMLCKHVTALAGIRETQANLTPVESNLPRAMRVAVDAIAPKFGSLVQSFAALDGPSERLCIQLLMELATAEDGTLSLWQLRERRPDLGPAIDRFVGERRVDALREHHPGHDQHILYDVEAATLVIDDPQLTFYLRQLNEEQLAVKVGKWPTAKRTRVFVSYSHRDAPLLRRLRVHLKPLERQGLIDLWDDTRIAAGSLWRDEIDAALDGAKVAVLLVSADFLASDFIVDNELPPLLAAAARDGCTVLPLLVKPSLFEQTPPLNRFQVVNPDATPLSGMSSSEREAVLVELAKRVASLVPQQHA